MSCIPSIRTEVIISNKLFTTLPLFGVKLHLINTIDGYRISKKEAINISPKIYSFPLYYHDLNTPRDNFYL
jgi:hypothetical protein